MKEILLKLSDNEYSDYVINGRSMYSKRMKREISDEEYARWIFVLGEYVVMYDTKFICAVFIHYLYCYYKEMIMMTDFIHALSHFHKIWAPIA